MKVVMFYELAPDGLPKARLAVWAGVQAPA